MINIEIQDVKNLDNNTLEEEPKNLFQNFLSLSILIIILMGILLGLNYLLRPVIESNKNNEILEYIQSFEPEATRAIVLESKNFPVEVNKVYQNLDTKTQAIDLVSSGYNGDIRALVAIDSEGIVKGILIISHKETPGLGSELLDYNYLKEYNNLTIDDFKNYTKLDTNTYPVDIVAGSTITSGGVTELAYLGLLTFDVGRTINN